MKTTQTHRWLKVLMMGVLTWSPLGCGTPGNAAAGSAGEAAGEVLRAPLKIPMPLDKAGHKVDVIFDIPEPPKGERARGYFLGLRLLFAPSDPDNRISVIDTDPVSIRVKMQRLEGGGEQPVEFVRLERVGSLHGPGRYVPVPIKDGVVIARRSFTEYSGAPRGTPDASTYVMEFAAPRDSSAGRYRLRVETLKDLPSLNGFKAFLAFEQGPKR